jgi:hypothetical protein
MARNRRYCVREPTPSPGELHHSRATVAAPNWNRILLAMNGLATAAPNSN